MFKNLRYFILVVLIFTAADGRAANSLQRDEDPVVLTGSDLLSLTGEDPGTIVAFRYESGWVQIPVQIDERDVVDFGTPYDTTDFDRRFTVYVDTSTFTGPDRFPEFDVIDELVFMAKDAGDQRAPGAAPDPAGVLAGTREEIGIYDGVNYQWAYVYLFVTDGSLTPDAGQDYVTYNFDLLSGDYKTTYSILSGPNPEDTEVVTGYYRMHFSDRWIRDEINVKAGAATEVDILDRHKNLFAPGNCGRSEDTFSAGEGCFVTNIDGPVRAIRSYLGANSGPFTQREHKFYERRHDVTTFLRVHAISGVMDYYDYSPAASGMVYYNDLNPGGVTIDGDPAGDPVVQGAMTWEMVTGAQGTLVMAERIYTDIPGFAYTSYYSDRSAPIVTQCTGDAFEYGASGPWINQAIPNTDPYLGMHNYMNAARIVYFEPPGGSVSRAGKLAAQANTPMGSYGPTAVQDKAPRQAYALMQNTPNPFSSATIIGFEAPLTSRVSVRVYDVAGRFVKSLEPWVVSGGRASVSWDATDFRGEPVPSGIYFYRLSAPGYSSTKKMVLIK